MRNKNKLLFGRGLALMLSFGAISLFGIFVYTKVIAASYSDISALPTLPTPPGNSSNPVNSYDIRFQNGGDQIKIMGRPNPTGQEYTTTFNWRSVDIDLGGNGEKTINYYDASTPRADGYSSAVSTDENYKKLFNNTTSWPYVPLVIDTTTSTNGGWFSCNNLTSGSGGARVYIISFNIKHPNGITTQQVLDGIKEYGIRAAIDAGAVETTKNSPYNLILCSDSEVDQNLFIGDSKRFPNSKPLTGWRVEVKNAGAGGSGGGGGSGNRERWFDYSGTQLGKDDLHGRFVFTSPNTIVDMGTDVGGGKKLTYSLASTSSPPYPENSDELWNDGIAFYVPTKDGKAIEKSQGKCLGFFMVDSDGRADGEDYGKVYGIPAYDSGGSCRYGAKDIPVINILGFVPEKNIEDFVSSDQKSRWQVTSDILINNGPHLANGRRMWYSTLYWEDSKNIVPYGEQTMRLTQVSAAEKDVRLKAINYSGNRDSAQIWTSAKCKEDKQDHYNFIVINYDNDKNQKDTDIYSSNALATVYVGNQVNGISSWENRWDGSDRGTLECLFGAEIEFNWVGPGDRPAYTFVSGIARSVDNKDGSYQDDAPPVESGNVNGEGDNKPTCISSGFSLSWLVCPIINGIADGADAIFDKLIVPLLVTKPLPTGTSSNNAQYQAWTKFRDIANVLLIIFLLLSIYGMAKG